jgi:hypothetical protein
MVLSGIAVAKGSRDQRTDSFWETTPMARRRPPKAPAAVSPSTPAAGNLASSLPSTPETTGTGGDSFALRLGIACILIMWLIAIINVILGFLGR